VVGMPDERLGEKACTYVVLAEPSAALTLDDITAYLRARKFATQKLPERLQIVPALPMTATGKVQKHILRADIKNKLEEEARVR
jgi:non-ribosomal peptide synthetase component E (peptide arylation enzyme)